MPFERCPRFQQRLRVGAAAGGRRTRDQTDRDRRGARAEPSLERDAVVQREPVALDRLEELEGAQREMGGVARHFVGALAGHLDAERLGLLRGELVPEVERDADGVEAGAEVGGRGGCGSADHETASSTASTVGSTASVASSSTAPASLRPCPVRMQTTARASPTPICSSAATPAADAGSQNTPSSRAIRLHAARNSSSVSETT